MGRTMVYFLLAIFGGLLATNGWAEPAINSVSGTMTQMQTVTIIGSGFGAKSPAAPELWDTVDNIASYAGVADGEAIPEGGSNPWGGNADGAAKMETTEAQRHSHSTKMYKGTGTKVLFSNHPIQKTGKVYAAWWWKPDSNPIPNPSTLYSAKFIRFNETGQGNPGNHQFVWSILTPLVYRIDEGDLATNWWYDYPGITGQWNFHEVWIDSVAQTVSLRVNAVVMVNNFSWSQMTPFSFDNLWGIGWEGNNADSSLTSWMDDIYVDSSFARVIIGNASTYADITHKELQIPTAWSGSSVSVTVNTGSFSANERAYLYVVAPDGTVNSQGYPIDIGGGTGASAPTSPTALLVR